MPASSWIQCLEFVGVEILCSSVLSAHIFLIRKGLLMHVSWTATYFSLKYPGTECIQFMKLRRIWAYVLKSKFQTLLWRVASKIHVTSQKVNEIIYRFFVFETLWVLFSSMINSSMIHLLIHLWLNDGKGVEGWNVFLFRNSWSNVQWLFRFTILCASTKIWSCKNT